MSANFEQSTPCYSTEKEIIYNVSSVALLTPEPGCPKAVYRILLIAEQDNPKLTKTLKGLCEVFIEGTECDIDRPPDREEQRRHYSGKKAIRSKIM